MENQNRRTFLKNSMITGSAFVIKNPVSLFNSIGGNRLKEIRIKKVDSNYRIPIFTRATTYSKESYSKF